MRSFKLPANILVNGFAERNRPPRAIFALYACALLLICCAGSLSSAQTVTTRVTGTVKGTAGATVPGVKVTLTDTGSKDQKTAVTNDEGTFTITDVRVGSYFITAEGT